MSALTKEERDGLDEVFLSIHGNSDKYRKLKELSSLIMKKGGGFSVNTLAQEAKHTLKETSFSQFLAFIAKTKKSLSK